MSTEEVVTLCNMRSSLAAAARSCAMLRLVTLLPSRHPIAATLGACLRKPCVPSRPHLLRMRKPAVARCFGPRLQVLRRV
jgi:hypothetical protein